MTIPARLAAIAALMAFGPWAHATSGLPGQANVHFSNITLTTVDLDPLDAQLPSLESQGGIFISSVDIGGYRINDFQGLPYKHALAGTTNFRLGSASNVAELHAVAGDAEVGSSADVTPGLSSLAPFDILVLANTALADMALAQSSSAYVTVSVYNSGPSLVLSPHTQLLLTGQVDMHADFETSMSIPGTTDGTMSYVAGWGVSLIGGSQSFSAQDYLYFDTNRDGARQQLTLSLSNNSDRPINVSLNFTAMASAGSLVENVSAVPEPADYALALAGMTVVMARRKRRPVL